MNFIKEVKMTDFIFIFLFIYLFIFVVVVILLLLFVFFYFFSEFFFLRHIVLGMSQRHALMAKMLRNVLQRLLEKRNQSFTGWYLVNF